jgi:glycopeptide antibiotics resistance protein
MFFSENFGRSTESVELRYNIVLFKEIERFIYYRRQLGMWTVFWNLAGNILCFMPFGFFLPAITTQKIYKNVFSVTVCGFAFSLIIEMSQLFTRVGAFDVDDLLLNTVGGFLGCLLYHFCNFLRIKITDNLKRKKAEIN